MSQISVFSAILFSINTIIGSGLFLNTGILINLLSVNSFIIYPLTALLILPIIYACYDLARSFPGKNLQHIFSYVSPLFGKRAAWAYSVSKLATASVATLFGSRILEEILSINSKFFIFAALLFFVFFNIRNVAFNRNVQKIIFCLKILPILILSFYGINHLLSDFYNYYNNFRILKDVSVGNYISSIILVIFSFAGFESIFAIASNVNNSEKNTSRVIFSSFLLSLVIYTLYQFVVSQVFSNLLDFSDLSFDNVLRLFIEKVEMPLFLKKVVLISIACSVYGLAYSLLYANSRNVFFIFKERDFTVPLSVLMTSFFMVLYILFLKKMPVFLQQLSAIGTIINYILLTYIYAKRSCKKSIINKLILLSIAISVVLLFLSIISSATKVGYIGCLIYIFILLLGKLII